jgi:hypothetical protein
MEDLFRVGLRALLDDDQELLDAVERAWGKAHRPLGEVPIRQDGHTLPSFWWHVIFTWLLEEVALPEAVS